MASVINTLSKWCKTARGSLNLRLLYVSQPHGDKSLQAFRQHPCLMLAFISCTYSSWRCNKESCMRGFGWTLCSAYRGLFLQTFFVATAHVLLSSCARVVHLLFWIFIMLCYIWALLNGIEFCVLTEFGLRAQPDLQLEMDAIWPRTEPLLLSRLKSQWGLDTQSQRYYL